MRLTTVGSCDRLRSRHPHDNLPRYTDDDAPEATVDHPKPREIGVRERGLDPRVQQRHDRRRELDHSNTTLSA